MDPARLRGAVTALVTPFRDGAVDRTAFADLAEWQIAEGIDGLAPAGTTGEAPTLTPAERIDLIRQCVEIARGRVPVIAGTGTNDTAATIAFTRAAEAAGADAALIVTPYYNRPNQEGLFRHYEAIARETRLPIIVYNVPARTGVDLALATIERLAELPNIIGIKDATGDLARVRAIAAATGDRFVQLSGHDQTALGFALSGGAGTISVASNVAPRLFAGMHAAIARGEIMAARAIDLRLRPLLAALERETNPIAVKQALAQLRGISPEVRLPLTPATPETAAATLAALAGLERRPARLTVVSSRTNAKRPARAAKPHRQPARLAHRAR